MSCRYQFTHLISEPFTFPVSTCTDTYTSPRPRARALTHARLWPSRSADPRHTHGDNTCHRQQSTPCARACRTAASYTGKVSPLAPCPSLHAQPNNSSRHTTSGEGHASLATTPGVATISCTRSLKTPHAFRGSHHITSSSCSSSTCVRRRPFAACT